MEMTMEKDNMQELARARTELRVLNLSFIHSMALKCALELNIPDIIHRHGDRKHATASELVSAAAIPPSKSSFLRRLMRLLAHDGIFSKLDVDGEESYGLTSMSSLLLDEPGSLRSAMLMGTNPAMLAPWSSASAWLIGDEPTAVHTAHGKPLYQVTAERPELNKLFNEGMESYTRMTMQVAVKECPEVFRSVRWLIDVGGGSGAAAEAVAKAFPDVKCAVLELPHVVAELPENAYVEFVAGDMFHYVPSADAVMLKSVLHNWNDEDCVKILKLCKEAIPPKEKGGKVIIIDGIFTEDDSWKALADNRLLMDLQMMVMTSGRERNEDEWRKLFVKAEFSDHKIVKSLGLLSVIEVYP